MSQTDEPEWMLDRLRQMEADGVLIKRSPLDPPLPPIRFGDFASEPPTYEEATSEAHRPNHEPTWEPTSGGRVCSLCGHVESA